MSKPAKSILDPTFKYVPSVETDLRKTFARVREQAAKPMTDAEKRAEIRSLGDSIRKLKAAK